VRQIFHAPLPEGIRGMLAVAADVSVLELLCEGTSARSSRRG
jgi:hypothetical protein